MIRNHQFSFYTDRAPLVDAPTMLKAPKHCLVPQMTQPPQRGSWSSLSRKATATSQPSLALIVLDASLLPPECCGHVNSGLRRGSPVDDALLREKKHDKSKSRAEQNQNQNRATARASTREALLRKAAVTLSLLLLTTSSRTDRV